MRLFWRQRLRCRLTIIAYNSSSCRVKINDWPLNWVKCPKKQALYKRNSEATVNQYLASELSTKTCLKASKVLLPLFRKLEILSDQSSIAHLNQQKSIICLETSRKQSHTGIIERKSAEIIQKMCQKLIVSSVPALHQVFRTDNLYQSPK